MMNKELRPLTLAEKKWINATWPGGMDIKKFMTSKILAVPAGSSAGAARLLSSDTSPAPTSLEVNKGGFVTPPTSMVEIKKGTMFVQAYIKIYDKYDFPTQSLYENRCLAFCPDGFASVNGVC
jgi:hypothetical protein